MKLTSAIAGLIAAFATVAHVEAAPVELANGGTNALCQNRYALSHHRFKPGSSYNKLSRDKLAEISADICLKATAGTKHATSTHLFVWTTQDGKNEPYMSCYLPEGWNPDPNCLPKVPRPNLRNYHVCRCRGLTPKTPAPTPSPTPAPVATSCGDPHIKTWSGAQYDFHGGCDLVLLQNPNFANGLGMNIHVRTKINTWWSYIESAVVQIGDNTLQIQGSADKHITQWTNGEDKKELETGDGSLGDYVVHHRRINDHQSLTRIDLGNGDAIGIESFKKFVRVNVNNKMNVNFDGALGLLGAFPTGKKIGRDGEQVFEDPNEFGQEWMVKASDNLLFPDVEASQLPLACPMPTEVNKKESMRRRLGEAGISKEEAEESCACAVDSEKDGCVQDVLITQDKETAYMHCYPAEVADDDSAPWTNDAGAHRRLLEVDGSSHRVLKDELVEDPKKEEEDAKAACLGGCPGMDIESDDGFLCVEEYMAGKGVHCDAVAYNEAGQPEE